MLHPQDGLLKVGQRADQGKQFFHPFLAHQLLFGGVFFEDAHPLFQADELEAVVALAVDAKVLGDDCRQGIDAAVTVEPSAKEPELEQYFLYHVLGFVGVFRVAHRQPQQGGPHPFCLYFKRCSFHLHLYDTKGWGNVTSNLKFFSFREGIFLFRLRVLTKTC